MIQFEHVHLRYDTGISLRNMNFSVREKEFLYLYGPSGSGKTSILGMIYMELFPNDGQVNVLGYNSNIIKRREVAVLRKHVGMVFQSSRLLVDRDVYSNIALPLELLGLPTKDIRRKVSIIADELGIRSRLSHSPQELSGGEQQRVSLARAVINSPDILLVDEPTAHLDDLSTREVTEAIWRIHEKGTSVLFATHDENLLKLDPSRTLILDSGEIIEDRSI